MCHIFYFIFNALRVLLPALYGVVNDLSPVRLRLLRINSIISMTYFLARPLPFVRQQDWVRPGAVSETEGERQHAISAVCVFPPQVASALAMACLKILLLQAVLREKGTD